MYPSTVALWGKDTEFVRREEKLWHFLCGSSNDQVRKYVLNVCVCICTYVLNVCACITMYYCNKMYVRTCCMCVLLY